MRYRTVAVAIVFLIACPDVSARTFSGTKGVDRFTGTNRADVARGKGGNDVLVGLEGNDLLFGGPGKDILRGGLGADGLYGQAQADRIHGGQGRDRLFGGRGRDVLSGGPGNDVLTGSAENDRLLAGRGDDQVRGDPGNDLLNGGLGADRLLGGAGEDSLRGGPGHDRLDGGPGKDRIVCGAGVDVVLSADDDEVADDCEATLPQANSWSSSDVWQALGLVALGVAVLLVAGLLAAQLERGRASHRPNSPAPVAHWLPFVLPFPALGLLGIAIYTLTSADGAALAIALLTAGGAFLTGGLFGFLFGIPKSLARPEGNLTSNTSGVRRFDPNTNLEQISDWLTKIIVGLALVQFGQLIDQVQRLTNFLAPSLGGTSSSPSFALGILLLFSISGFLTLYVATRLYAGREFARGETSGEAAANSIQAALRVLDDKADSFVAAEGAG